ncbi:hypothetical protein EOD42_07495 [Rhodovarius crocodyli]|uniref:Toprim domain-containing protein n=1 Tax=Rhodovarius crocodyli TaxID=1979269 RepID=A0A437MJ15_9PROT|nr:hypothetical protein [Rhodovarius crocodyli]RVT97654.1 hypothetical protein EOD42_07495 [Rhodovarius crocodyli]
MADGLHDPFAPLDAGPVVYAPELPAEPAGPAAQPPPDNIRHRRHGTPAATWRYRDHDGALLFAVCRFDLADGGKEVLPLTCGSEGWRWKAPADPRPLYGLDRLAARPHAPVVVVEGEKAADAAGTLFPDFVAVCWQGGSNAVGKADWSPLRGRVVAVWPDNDPSGRKAAAEVVKAVTAVGAARVGVVAVPEAWPPRWDVADPLPEGTTAEMVIGMLASAVAEVARCESPGDALRADVARAADMPREDWLAARLEIARKHRVPVAEFDALRAEALREKREAERAVRPNDEPPVDPRGRADLFVDAADLPDTAGELAGLLAAQPHLFDRGGPARVARDRTRDAFVVELLTHSGVVTEAHRIARPWQWVRLKDGSTERRDVTLSERVAKLYLDDRDRWGLRPLDGITSAPLLHADGSLRAVEGYDPETHLWCERIPSVDVPERPSRDDASAALHRLRRWFRTFAFADSERVQEPETVVTVVDTSKPPGADESAFLCALVTAVCRPCLWLAPGLLVRAPEYSGAGTGKGLLVRAICAVAFGARPVAMTAGASPEELDKRITAALMEAGPTLFLDNVNGMALKSDVLASAITERPAAVRPLGRSTTIQLNPTAFVAATGNGLLLSEDMARRFLTVELDANMEDPEARDFRGDLLRDTLVERKALLTDVLTIWRWGRQMDGQLPAGRALGSFNDWGRWCRDPLLALGCQDPVARVADAKARDPRRQNVAEIFNAWWEAHGSSAIGVKDLAEAVRDVADPASRGRQYLQARVRALIGTRAAGFVLIHSAAEGKWSGDKYALRQAVGQSAVTSQPEAPVEAKPWSGLL